MAPCLSSSESTIDARAAIQAVDGLINIRVDRFLPTELTYAERQLSRRLCSLEVLCNV